MQWCDSLRAQTTLFLDVETEGAGHGPREVTRRCCLLRLICGHSFSDLSLETLLTVEIEKPDLSATFQRTLARHSYL